MTKRSSNPISPEMCSSPPIGGAVPREEGAGRTEEDEDSKMLREGVGKAAFHLALRSYCKNHNLFNLLLGNEFLLQHPPLLHSPTPPLVRICWLFSIHPPAHLFLPFLVALPFFPFFFYFLAGWSVKDKSFRNGIDLHRLMAPSSLKMKGILSVLPYSKLNSAIISSGKCHSIWDLLNSFFLSFHVFSSFLFLSVFPL